MSLVDKKDFENFVHYEKKYVATYKELILTFLAFCVILFVLYPKDLLKDQILSEASNYDLSMLYLKNMLDNDPENESLMIGLAEQSLRSGKRDLSFRLLQLLHNSKDANIKQKAYLLSYKLAKEDYFFLEEKKEKKEKKKQIKYLYLDIVNAGYYEDNDYDRWYTEGVFVKNNPWTYYFLQKKVDAKPHDIQLLEEIYYMSIKLNKKNDSMKYLHSLQNEDKKRKIKWIFAEYHLVMNDKKYMQAEMVLQRYSDNSILFKEELANFYSGRGAYVKSSSTYMNLYNYTKGYQDKKIYLLKALDALRAGNYSNKAVSLASQYESNYINDREVRTFILKVYIGANRLDKAGNLAKKLLKKR